MMRPITLIVILCLLGLSGCSGSNGPPEPGAPPYEVEPARYNAILISIDTLRADHLACFGYDRKTASNLDDFAAKSVIFDRAYSQSPWTTPSHATLFTSLYPSVLNIGDWPNPGKINPRAYTIAECLRDYGYETAGFLEAGMVAGKFGFAQGFKPYRQGFQHIHESVPVCLDWIKEKKDKRFFVFLHTYDVHRYDPPGEFRDEYVPEYEGAIEEGIPLARSLQHLQNHEFLSSLTDRDREKIISIYDEGIRYVDHWIGKFLKSVEEMGLLENTVVIITSDHGEEFWEHNHTGHGYTNFEEMLHVPMIIRHPVVPAGRRGAMVRLIDVAPTIADMLGAPIRSEWQGRSFFKDLKGAESRSPRYSFAEKGHVNRKSVQDSRWKLIRTYRVKKDDQSPFKDRLFDLKNDPDEKNDVAKRHPEEMARLTKLLEAWMEANDKIKGGYEAIEVEIDPELKKQLEELGYGTSSK
ncbi:MAG: sulfatase family protein [Planctomycetota bacterium]|jgi:arylsulfatase A-like enzyme